MKCLSECPNSKKTPLPSQIPGYTLLLNGLCMGYSTKISIHKFFGTAVIKIMNMLHDFQFHNLKFSQKGLLDFHVTTATVDLCMKEVIDSLLRRAL